MSNLQAFCVYFQRRLKPRDSKLIILLKIWSLLACAKILGFDFFKMLLSLTSILKKVKIDVFSHFLSCLPTFRCARKLETLNLAFLRIYWSYNLLCKSKTFKKFEPWSYSNWILNTKYWKPKGSHCTLSKRRVFGPNFYELHCHKTFNNC